MTSAVRDAGGFVVLCFDMYDVLKKKNGRF